jgi:hypothetical protein
MRTFPYYSSTSAHRTAAPGPLLCIDVCASLVLVTLYLLIVVLIQEALPSPGLRSNRPRRWRRARLGPLAASASPPTLYATPTCPHTRCN